MRAALLIALALALAGCEHFYGAGEISLTDAQAVRIARWEAAKRGISLKGLEPAVARFETGTTVVWETPECLRVVCLDGGVPRFFIPAGKRRVTYVATDDA